jgi:cobalt-zinc-cadmium efflux system outer membrane protein
MMRRLAIVTAICALLPSGLRAQADRWSGPSGLTLSAAVDSALKNNLDLRSARSLADSARAETRIARALPNPTIAAVPNTPFQYAATLPLDIGPQRIFRVRASDLGAVAAGADVQDSVRHVVLGVRRAFFDVLLADARRDIVGGRRDIMRQLVAADSARVRAGDLPERALIRSEVELVRAEAEDARARLEAQGARLALQSAMGMASPDTALRVDGDLRYRDITFGADGMRAPLENRPDVTASRVREAQSAAAQRLARSLVIPVPQLSFVRQITGPFESGHYYALGIGIEVPILNQYRGVRERADAAHDAAGYARRRTEAQAEREVQSATATFRAQQALVRRYESGVIAAVAQGVDAARYAYARGATSLLEVLDALRAQQDVLTEYRTALHDYWVAAYTVEAVTGVPAR